MNESDANVGCGPLLAALIRATQQCRVWWEPTNDQTTFRIMLKSGLVRIASAGADRYRLTAIDDEGWTLIDRLFVATTMPEHADARRLYDLASNGRVAKLAAILKDIKGLGRE